MEEIEFACLFNRLQKSLNVELHSDLVGHIYDIYVQTYDNYGLFELYDKLKKAGAKITTEMMNWNDLLKIAKHLDIPQKHMNEPVIRPSWYLMRDRNDVMSITMVYPKFEILNYDVIRMSDGFTYSINEIYLLDPDLYATDDEDAIQENCRICLENIDTGEYTDIKTTEFLFELDCNDIQYIESNWLDFVNK
jgi:hypothetical protein